MLYLDYAATTPVDPRVVEAMIPYFTEHFANPSSKHICGTNVKDAVEKCRKKLANLMDVSANDVVFTSGASEANNLVIKGVAECYAEPRHFVTSSFEHKATLKAFEDLERWGHEVTYIAPGPDGVIDPEDVEDAIGPDTVLCSIMHVNNEIGTVQDIEEIGGICREHGVIFHTDATQSFGKLPIKMDEWGIDYLSVSAHKLYGPKGVGALYRSGACPIQCQISGGSQEDGIRAGTSNVPGIVGLTKAAELSFAAMEQRMEHQMLLEELFLDRVLHRIPEAHLQGDVEAKVPWITNVCFRDIDAGAVRDVLSEQGLCISRSSACAKSGAASHVLQAISCCTDLIECALRFSFGKDTTKADVLLAAELLTQVIAQDRSSRAQDSPREAMAL
jgi:cysteine desulfurase